MNIKYFQNYNRCIYCNLKKLLNKNQTHIDNFYIEAIKSDFDQLKAI